MGGYREKAESEGMHFVGVFFKVYKKERFGRKKDDIGKIQSIIYREERSRGSENYTK